MRKPILALLFATAAFAQPTVTGAFNAASYVAPGLPGAGLAQGAMIAIFGRDLGPAAIVNANRFPLPTALGGTSARITAGGQSRDLILVYSLATQVGAIIPSDTPPGAGQITVTYNGQTSPALSVQIVASQFGIFAINQAGRGPAVAQNVNAEADRPVNTILNSAKPNQTMILWGTGLGAIQSSDAAAPPVGDVNQPIEVLVAGRRANVLYKGRSGCCAGIDQIVFEVPAGVQGCSVPLAVKNGNSVSNYTSIAVSPAGGACSDPFGYTSSELSAAAAAGTFNIGAIALSKTVTKITVAGVPRGRGCETGSAAFVSIDRGGMIGSPGANGAAVSVGACTLFTLGDEDVPASGPVAGARILDAGAAINVNGPKGTRQLTKASDHAFYSSLFTTPAGYTAPYLEPGDYIIDNGSGGADIGGFRANLTIPGNFTWSNEESIASVDRAAGVNITWSGADANSFVVVSGFSRRMDLNAVAMFSCLERGDAGRMTVPSAVLLGMPASGRLQGMPTGQLAVGITGEPSRFTARGIDVGVFSYTSMTAKDLGYQ